MGIIGDRKFGRGPNNNSAEGGQVQLIEISLDIFDAVSLTYSLKLFGRRPNEQFPLEDGQGRG